MTQLVIRRSKVAVQPRPNGKQRGNDFGPWAKVFSSNFHTLRKAHGWTLGEVSERVTAEGRHMGRMSIQRVAQGLRRVDVDDLMVFAVIFGVSPNDLLSTDLKVRVEVETSA